MSDPTAGQTPAPTDATEHRVTITITPITDAELAAFVEAFRERFGRKRLVHVPSPWGRHAATIVRAALARDVLAEALAAIERKADDIAEAAMRESRAEELALELSDEVRALRAARDVPAPTDEPDTGVAEPSSTEALRAELAETRAELDRMRDVARTEDAAKRDAMVTADVWKMRADRLATAGDALADAAEDVIDGPTEAHLDDLGAAAEAWRALRAGVPAPGRAGDDEPRPDHFLAKLDGLVNTDDLGALDPEDVRAALDEAQATIRRLRAGGGHTAGQDERLARSEQIGRALTTLRSALGLHHDEVAARAGIHPQRLGALESGAEPDVPAGWIRPILAALAAPADDTAGQDEPAADEVLLVRLDGRKGGQVTVGHSRLPVTTVLRALGRDGTVATARAAYPDLTEEAGRVLAALREDLPSPGTTLPRVIAELSHQRDQGYLDLGNFREAFDAAIDFIERAVSAAPADDTAAPDGSATRPVPPWQVADALRDYRGHPGTQSELEDDWPRAAEIVQWALSITEPPAGSVSPDQDGDTARA
ncbi:MULTISPECIES: helix-turn-helix domain-containing protein [Pseudonocardia]|uniref:Uncharacterized protein n=2 Tax=Pseudonocardia TaxID=1847 RepID=A0A1Y2MN64_PSEAH|nr:MULTISPECIES: helix-turn-helix domain-containing protein [Pseudonocardia]OSY36097.1 hypothetical protein BG845_05612 [Pseudonocardia autotrophica]TDN77579.1 helix-turn-helix protein [Pseudonocardia autotrophica]BBG01609.1 hypothetical protein Pdca_28180 [Pseudonocardia autotrophica]GEC25354.1 hypothetical protein PSA01_23830 [Pseudonocardia saturnea]